MREEVFLERVEAAGRQLSGLEKRESLGTNLSPAPKLKPKEVEHLQGKLRIKEPFQHIGSNLWAAVTTATPEMMLHWLTQFRPENRDPSAWQFEALKTDINQGAWSLTHQGFGFEVVNGEPVFRDGQHRAFAILDAQRDVLAMVVLNIPATAMPVIDRHRMRRLRDLNVFAGQRMTEFHEAVIRRCMLGDKVPSGIHTIPQLGAFLEAHRERLEWAVGLFDGPRLKGIRVSGVVAAIFRASFHFTTPETRSRLEAFTTGLIAGRVVSEEDQVVITLRNVLQNPLSRKKQSAEVIYLKTVRAIDAFMKGENPHRLYEASTDLFPLPKGTELEVEVSTPDVELVAT
jgi:hypothetical protein